MIAALKRFLSDLTGPPEGEVDDTEERCRIAAAALLYHVIGIDGEAAPKERETLRRLLRERFDLDEASVGALLRKAEDADREAVDLYGFTSVLKRELGEAERERIIEMMWTIVYADGKVHEFEDNLVWRAAELLAIPAQTRIRLKQSVRPDDNY